ncbi:hypothetical protein LNTAR_02829 [Lentisphaera araneosa HTCC2155]|uniref:Uncharacterized protein n=1 Tax=Lentisphaera araneosa HTCC2155 TaxID=313628 RepID=A6DTC8_9BACT|nr:hypothetical protein LNTAR_02829 [Lentisphaera araneosa HTCC2155]
MNFERCIFSLFKKALTQNKEYVIHHSFLTNNYNPLENQGQALIENQGQALKKAEERKSRTGLKKS